MTPPPPRFADFYLLIGAGRNKKHPLQVVDSPAGQAQGVFTWPFPRRPNREPWRDQDQQEFGSRLFDALFTGDVRRCWDASLGQVSALGQGLRLRLQASDDLTSVPWEVLYDAGHHTFLAWDESTPVVRSPAVMEPRQPFQCALPLHLVVALASPRDLPALDVEGEKRLIAEVLSPLEAAGSLRVTILEKATPQALKDRLDADFCHILHIVAHGEAPEGWDQAALCLEDEEGLTQLLSANDLAAWARNHNPLRLVVLNSCSTASPGGIRPLGSMAAHLVQAGLPAVVAMQFPITDRAACTFAGSFYQATAQAEPVEVAVTRARLQVKAAPATSREWSTPVLYLRSQEGQIFQFARPVPARSTTTPLVQQAYAVWSRLFYSSAFLEDPQEPRAGLKDLVRGDPEAVQAEYPGGWWQSPLRRQRPYGETKWSPAYVLGVGRLVDGAENLWSIEGLAGVAGFWGHIPHIIEPTWLTELVDPQVPPKTKLQWHLRLHLFAYGLVNALLTLQVRSPQGLKPEELLLLLRQASPFYDGAAAEFALRRVPGQERVAKQALLPLLAARTVQGIFGKELRLEPVHAPTRPSRRHESFWPGERAGYLYLQRADPPLDPERDLRTVAQWVGLTPDWERANVASLGRFRPPQSSGQEGLGRLEGDWILLGNRSSFLYTPVLHSDRERRHFFWQVLAAAELARCQAVLYRIFADRLTGQWARLYRRQRDPAAWLQGFFRGSGEKPDLVCFWEDLLQFGDRLPDTPAFVRKSYRLVGGTLSLKEERDRFVGQLERFTETVATWKSPPQQLLGALRDVRSVVPL